jgi:hypothetical protein
LSPTVTRKLSVSLCVFIAPREPGGAARGPVSLHRDRTCCERRVRHCLNACSSGSCRRLAAGHRSNAPVPCVNRPLAAPQVSRGVRSVDVPRCTQGTRATRQQSPRVEQQQLATRLQPPKSANAPVAPGDLAAVDDLAGPRQRNGNMSNMGQHGVDRDFAGRCLERLD